MWLELWDFIARENEKKKKDREENEVIDLSQKPQSQACKRGREGGGGVFALAYLFVYFHHYFHTRWSGSDAEGLRERLKKGKAGSPSVFHSVFQVRVPPALQKTRGAAHRASVS